MANYGFYVERQGWTHWPKVLIMRHKTGNGPDETRRYAPERGECQVDACELRLPATRYYRCKTCGAFFAVMDASSDIAPRVCPNCGRRITE